MWLLDTVRAQYLMRDCWGSSANAGRSISWFALVGAFRRSWGCTLKTGVALSRQSIALGPRSGSSLAIRSEFPIGQTGRFWAGSSDVSRIHGGSCLGMSERLSYRLSCGVTAIKLLPRKRCLEGHHG